MASWQREHERKRAIEARVFALRDALEEEGVDDAAVDARCEALRRQLAAGGGDAPAAGGSAPLAGAPSAGGAPVAGRRPNAPAGAPPSSPLIVRGQAAVWRVKSARFDDDASTRVERPPSAFASFNFE